MDKKTQLEFKKLELLGFVKQEIRNKSQHRVLFISKEYVNENLNSRFGNMSCIEAGQTYGYLRATEMCSFIYCYIKGEWIKNRLGVIPEMTETEKVLYGK